ncbi:MAG: hypothetical protein CM15mP36_13060 [Flavobacteriales bacterium]|nr:MAG: hypothetical protein CM15mP36_13060 [Flavobacteriales bacterium]
MIEPKDSIEATVKVKLLFNPGLISCELQMHRP